MKFRLFFQIYSERDLSTTNYQKFQSNQSPKSDHTSRSTTHRIAVCSCAKNSVSVAMPSLAAFAAPAALAPGSWSRRAQCARAATHTRVARVRCAVPVSVGAEDFGSEVLQAEGPVLVDFHASWCGPCKVRWILERRRFMV